MYIHIYTPLSLCQISYIMHKQRHLSLEENQKKCICVLCVAANQRRPDGISPRRSPGGDQITDVNEGWKPAGESDVG